MKRVRQFFSRYRSGLQRAGAVLLALAVWQGLAMGVGQKLLVPSPLSVVERLGGIWQEADFWGTVWFTFRKIVAGFLLGLADSLSLPVRALSGGMKRRVSIARAVLAPGPLLVLDEPFTGLDRTTKAVVLDYLKRYTQGRTLLLVTHDPAERDALAHSTLQMPSQIT